MSEIQGNNIPDLGQLGKEHTNGHNKKIHPDNFKPMVLARALDEDGSMEPESVRLQTVMVSTPNGPQTQVVEQAVLGRKNIVTAEDLVEMMRVMVKEEIQAYSAELIHTMEQNYDRRNS